VNPPILHVRTSAWIYLLVNQYKYMRFSTKKEKKSDRHRWYKVDIFVHPRYSPGLIILRRPLGALSVRGAYYY
jgi:hypothetical protein